MSEGCFIFHFVLLHLCLPPSLSLSVYEYVCVCVCVCENHLFNDHLTSHGIMVYKLDDKSRQIYLLFSWVSEWVNEWVSTLFNFGAGHTVCE